MEQIKQAPAFQFSEWTENTQGRQLSEVYQRYGETPYFTTDVGVAPDSRGNNHALLNSNRSPLGYVERAGKVMGLWSAICKIKISARSKT